MSNSAEPTVTKPRYLWPWVVAALVMLGVLIAVMSVRQEAQRVREQRQPQMPGSPP